MKFNAQTVCVVTAILMAGCGLKSDPLTSTEQEAARLESELGMECDSMEGIGKPNEYTCMRGQQAVVIEYNEADDAVESLGMFVQGLDPEFLLEFAEVYGFTREDVLRVVEQSEEVRLDGLMLSTMGGILIQLEKDS